MIERFTVDGDGKYWDKIENKYVTIDHLFRLVERLETQILKLNIENNGYEDTLARFEIDNRNLRKEVKELKGILDELRDFDKEKEIEIENIHKIYIEEGFRGIIEYAEQQLYEYGTVKEIERGLWLLATGGWSDHEFWLDCLLEWNFLYGKGHYRATTSGGGYYYSEEPWADINVRLE